MSRGANNKSGSQREVDTGLVYKEVISNDTLDVNGNPLYIEEYSTLRVRAVNNCIVTVNGYDTSYLSPVTITWAAGVATVTFPAAHGLVTGRGIVVSGVLAPNTELNGPKIITFVGATKISYPTTLAGAGAAVGTFLVSLGLQAMHLVAGEIEYFNSGPRTLTSELILFQFSDDVYAQVGLE